ncbi:protein kinase domain-containing protein [Duganella sp. LjRoot269]|jgi:serine/threonine-protein kinase|uniref:protein kinase domain-containing protein n=1 Tax=Duganella sp. LjRoot269 TaxID=3342305 RepID=UPI003ED05FB8
MNSSAAAVLDRTELIPPSAQYQIRRSLGEGGYGRVYEAWDSTLCRHVALKQLKGATAALSQRLLDEARRAASLRHAAFVKIFSVQGDPLSPSIVMELIDGVTLTQAVAAQPMPAGAALDVARQIAEAMCEAHRLHMIHGDIKPSNLMLDGSGKVRILDFGLASYIDPLATQSTMADDQQGTIAYMAPERLLGKGPSERSDVYALGAVLYELITGARPYAQLRGLGLAAAHIQSSSAAWPFGADADPAIVRLVLAMTSKEPSARLASMRAVVDSIDVLQRVSLPITATSRHPLRLNWRRILYAGLAGLLALGVVLAIQLTPAHQVLHPFSVADRFNAGMEALRFSDRDGNVDLAIGHFTAILEHRPRHAAAAAGLSLAYSLRYYSDRNDESWLRLADAGALQALRDDDQLSLAHAALAWVRDYQGQMESSLEHSRSALRLDPRNLFALRGEADLLIRMRRYAEARQVIEQAQLLYPKERIFYDLLGKLWYSQANYTAAETAFRRSIALEPDAVYAYGNLNAALLHQNRGDEALQVLQQGLAIRPSSRLYGHLGTALFTRGDYEAAAQAFQNAVSSSKGNPNEYLNWANLADTLRWLPGKRDASRQAYRHAADLLAPLLTHAAGDVTYLSRMGLYRAKLGERETAASYTAQALMAAADSADVHFRAAIAYEISGNRPAALASLVRSRALGYPQNLIETEPDLMDLRREPDYLALEMERKK